MSARIHSISRADKQRRAAGNDDVSPRGKAVRPTVRRTAASQHGAFEVHEHSFVRGSRSGGHYEHDGKWHTGTFSHSHEGGNQPHQHPDTGPATYTIDKDEWRRATGMFGGGRKKFTAKPTGEHFPIVELEDWQRSFEVRIVGDPQPELGNGPGVSLPERIAQTFRIPYRVIDERKRRA